jgi:hypothetical protein
MATARCYTCHTLRPLSDFSYRRKDIGISTTSRLKRYVGVLLQKPGAPRYNSKHRAGAIYRYRCVHPRAGTCPPLLTHAQRPMHSASRVEVNVQDEHPLRRDRRQHSGDVGGGTEVEVEIQACVEERSEFRREKEEAREKLRQCVDMVERNPVVDDNVGGTV